MERAYAGTAADTGGTKTPTSCEGWQTLACASKVRRALTMVTEVQDKAYPKRQPVFSTLAKVDLGLTAITSI